VRVVVALGGNALLKRGESLDADVQRHNVGIAADAVARLVDEHQIVVTHGNGPQVGLLALQAEAFERVPPYPLDVLDAESEGMIGYLIEQELRNRLPGRQVVTLLTQVQVDADDPAFSHPTKPIGPTFSEAEAAWLAEECGWSIAREGNAWRRVVPSPEPRRILELPAIRLLVDGGTIVVCAGGGGIPVVVSETGAFHGVEAVIDKDRAAALLAMQLDADALLLLTDVDAVYSDWGSDAARPFRQSTVEELRAHTFDTGSMGPKVDAACRFVEETDGLAGIGRLEDAPSILAGGAGTGVRRR
jgi:carbamate kinase